MTAPVFVSQRSYDYLLTQCGDLPKTDSSEHWVANYQGKLAILLKQIESEYPMPRRVLDIGSGLGGIDALLIKRTACFAALVDGECAGPDVLQYDLPFCSRSAVQQFMEENHVDPMMWSYHSPQDLPIGPFDLILSFASWCFHYQPDRYLKYVLDVCDHNAMFILDVRRDRPAWHEDLEKHLLKLRVIQNGANGKWDRIVYVKR